jgi:FixJ family two-component response regulator
MNSAFETQPLVFVVDDEPEIAKMLAVVLQMNLYNAVPYFESAEALAAARETPPDYLISDIDVPGMNGIELAKAVQDELRSCKILLFSGQIDAVEMVQKAKDEGHSFDLLLKPVQPKDLIAKLQSL